MSNDFIIGNTFGYSGPVTDKNGAAFNLTGYTVTGEMFSAPDNWGVKTKLSDVSVTVVDAITGIISVVATPIVTAAWAPGGARLRLKFVSGTGVTTSADSAKFNLRA